MKKKIKNIKNEMKILYINYYLYKFIVFNLKKKEEKLQI